MRIEKHLLKVLKGIVEYRNKTPGEFLEGWSPGWPPETAPVRGCLSTSRDGPGKLQSG